MNNMNEDSIEDYFDANQSLEDQHKTTSREEDKQEITREEEDKEQLNNQKEIKMESLTPRSNNSSNKINITREEEEKEKLNQKEIKMDSSALPRNDSSNNININSNNTTNNNNKKKRHSKQQRIFFRSLTLPPAKLPATGESKDSADSSSTRVDSSNNEETVYSPHFLPAIQLIAHVIVPLRKALIHFYMSYRQKDVERLEWKTLLAFGRLFRELISSPAVSSSNSTCGSLGAFSGSSSLSVGTPPDEGEDGDSPPVSSERFFPLFYACLVKYKYSLTPIDSTEAIRLLLQTIQSCSRSLPVTNQLWSALLDKACMGLIVRQSLVGRRSTPLEESITKENIVQRTHTEQCILWCPHELPITDLQRIKKKKKKKKKKQTSKATIDDTDDEEDDDDADAEEDVPTLQQLLEVDCEKRPLHTTTRKYHDFEKKNNYDFEVKIPTKFLDETHNDNNDTNDNQQQRLWNTTRSMQFASLTGYLFIGINRRQQPQHKNTNDDGDGTKNRNSKFDRSELAIPSRLDVTKLCTPQESNNKNKKTKTTNGGNNSSSNNNNKIIYELVGGTLYDEGDYVAVIKDSSVEVPIKATPAAAAVDSVDESDDDDEDDDEDEPETWKLMESEEVIPISESDILEFLKGEGNEDDEDEDDEDLDDDDFGPCGTLAVYKLVNKNENNNNNNDNNNNNTTTQKQTVPPPLVFDEMNLLLSDIVLSQVTGTLDSNSDYYIEEEIYEEEILEE